MKVIFRDIFDQTVDDALVFDLDSITVEDITEFKGFDASDQMELVFKKEKSPDYSHHEGCWK